MSMVDSLERMADWLRENVCQEVLLKPADPDARERRSQTADWEYELVHPAVHVMCTPTARDKPPGLRGVVPAIVLQPENPCRDDLRSGTRSYSIRMSFTAYDPGTHGLDVLTPVGDGTWEAGEPGTFRQTHDGWRDAWNFMDRAVRAIESERRVGPLHLDWTDGVEWGDYEYAESEQELYPFWLCWCRVAVTEPLARDVRVTEDPEESIEDYL